MDKLILSRAGRTPDEVVHVYIFALSKSAISILKVKKDKA